MTDSVNVPKTKARTQNASHVVSHRPKGAMAGVTHHQTNAAVGFEDKFFSWDAGM